MNSPFNIYGCSEAIDINITNEEISINSLVENYQNRDYKSLVKNAQQYVDKNKSSEMAWNLLALVIDTQIMLGLHLKFMKISYD